MHHIYHTEGLILGSKNSGEAGRYYYIFTRDLGMIHASAQGVRKMSSKLRFVLQDFAYVKIDLVQGRDFWRVTSASKTNTLEQLSKNAETFQVFFNIANLLKRLLAGFEPNEALFADLIKGLSVLEKIPARNAFSIADARPHDSLQRVGQAGGDTKKSVQERGADLRNIEAVIVLRILNNLGYIGGNETLQNLVKSPFEQDLIFEVSKSRTEVLSQINKALKETHL